MPCKWAALDKDQQQAAVMAGFSPARWDACVKLDAAEEAGKGGDIDDDDDDDDDKRRALQRMSAQMVDSEEELHALYAALPVVFKPELFQLKDNDGLPVTSLELLDKRTSGPVGIGIDLERRKLWIGKGGKWLSNPIDPNMDLREGVFPFVAGAKGAKFVLNLGTRPFKTNAPGRNFVPAAPGATPDQLEVLRGLEQAIFLVEAAKEAQGNSEDQVVVASAREFQWRQTNDLVSFSGAWAELKDSENITSQHGKSTTPIFGKHVMRNGVWSWSVVIEKTTDNDGDGIFIGIASTDKASWDDKGVYIARHYYGAQEVFSNGSRQAEKHLEEEKRLKDGSIVDMVLDFNKKTLTWALNGDKPREAVDKGAVAMAISKKGCVIMCTLRATKDAVRIDKVKGTDPIPVNQWVAEKHMVGRCFALCQLPGAGTDAPPGESVLRHGGAALLLPSKAAGGADAGVMRIKAINAQPLEVGKHGDDAQGGTRVSTEVMRVPVSQRAEKWNPLRSFEEALRAAEMGEAEKAAAASLAEPGGEGGDGEEEDDADRIGKALLRFDACCAHGGNLGLCGVMVDKSEDALDKNDDKEPVEYEVSVRPLAGAAAHAQLEVCVEWCGLRRVFLLRRVETAAAAAALPLNFESNGDDVDVLTQVGAQMAQVAEWLKGQVRSLSRRIRHLEAAKARFDALERKRRDEMKSSSMEQYMPPRILQGLLPATLLESYDFYEDCSQLGVFHGYPQRPVSYKEPDERTADNAEKLSSEAEVRRFRLLPQKPESYDNIIVVRLVAPDADSPALAFCSGTKLFALVRRLPMAATGGKPSTTDGHVLLSMSTATEGSQLHALASCLARTEPLSHVLAWCKAERFALQPTADEGEGGGRFGGFGGGSNAHSYGGAPAATTEIVPDLIELPRLKVTLRTERLKSGQWRVYSVNRSNFYLVDTMLQPESSLPPAALIKGTPHALLFRSQHAEYQILVPNVRPVRPTIKDRPFSTELVLVRDEKWQQCASTKTFLYSVHVSGLFVEPATLASALYLLVLRLMNRDYTNAVLLIGSIGTDTELTKEERQVRARSKKHSYPTYF